MDQRSNTRNETIVYQKKASGEKLSNSGLKSRFNTNTCLRKYHKQNQKINENQEKIFKIYKMGKELMSIINGELLKSRKRKIQKPDRKIGKIQKQTIGKKKKIEWLIDI